MRATINIFNKIFSISFNFSLFGKPDIPLKAYLHKYLVSFKLFSSYFSSLLVVLSMLLRHIIDVCRLREKSDER
jgi:hypothetical protein